ncbi:hypothetical protein ACWEGQ_10675 [Streptomyces seoulensis]
MRPAYRSALVPAPAPAPVRGSRAYALLTAALLLLLTVFTLFTASTANGAGTSTTSTSTSTSTGGGPRADDQCPAACAAPAGARLERHGERPAPPGQHTAAAPVDATAVPPPAPTPARTPPARAPAHASLSHPVPDRDRAPPAPSGT